MRGRCNVEDEGRRAASLACRAVLLEGWENAGEGRCVCAEGLWLAEGSGRGFRKFRGAADIWGEISAVGLSDAVEGAAPHPWSPALGSRQRDVVRLLQIPASAALVKTRLSCGANAADSSAAPAAAAAAPHLELRPGAPLPGLRFRFPAGSPPGQGRPAGHSAGLPGAAGPKALGQWAECTSGSAASWAPVVPRGSRAAEPLPTALSPESRGSSSPVTARR